MKELKITTNVRVYQYDELVKRTKFLVDKAKAMTENSYAPYSKFHVGAAVLLSNGKIVGYFQPGERRFPVGHVRRAHHRILRAFKISGSQV